MNSLNTIVKHINVLMNSECKLSCTDVIPLVKENTGLLYFNITYENNNFMQCTIKIVPGENDRPKFWFDSSRLKATEKSMPDRNLYKRFNTAYSEMSKIKIQQISIGPDMLTAATGRCALQLFDTRDALSQPCTSFTDMKRYIHKLECLANIHTALELEKKYTY